MTYGSINSNIFFSNLSSVYREKKSLVAIWKEEMWIKTWTSDTAKQKIQDSSLSVLEFVSCLGRVALWMRSR